MSEVFDHQDESSETQVREWAQSVVLRRLTSVASELYVLRGGVLMKHWIGCAARPAQDLDFVATQPFDAQVAMEQITNRLTAPPFDDGAMIRRELVSYEVIWAETAAPGLRISVHLVGQNVQVQQAVDIGFHDPIVPPPELIQLPIHAGPSVSVWAARRETGFAWKFHELFEKETWHSKHLYDLYAMVRYCQMDIDKLIPAIRIAFESRGTSLHRIERLMSGDFAHSRSRRNKWPKFCKKYPQLDIPRDHFELVRQLVDFIKPWRDRLE